MNPQNFTAYNSYTNASNNEGFQISWFSNALFLNTFKSGTGSGRPIHIQPANSDLFLGTADYWKISPSSSPAGNLLAVTDNSVDIGSNGANRPRNYLAAEQCRFSEARRFQLVEPLVLAMCSLRPQITESSSALGHRH